MRRCRPDIVGRLVLDVPGCILEVGVWISSSSLLSSPDASLANIIFFVAASAATAMGGRGGGTGPGGSGLEVCGRVLCVVGGEVKKSQWPGRFLLVNER